MVGMSRRVDLCAIPVSLWRTPYNALVIVDCDAVTRAIVAARLSLVGG